MGGGKWFVTGLLPSDADCDSFSDVSVNFDDEEHNEKVIVANYCTHQRHETAQPEQPVMYICVSHISFFFLISVPGLLYSPSPSCPQCLFRT